MVFPNSDIRLFNVMLRGYLFVHLPAMMLSIGLPLLGMLLAEPFWLKGLLVILFFNMGFALSLVLWSVTFPSWRSWAFIKIDTDNRKRLENLIASHHLSWGNNQFVEADETTSDDLQLESIKLDLDTPSEIKFHQKKGRTLLELGFKMVLLLSVSPLFWTGQVWIGFGLLVMSLLFGRSFTKLYDQLSSRGSLMMNNEGIHIFKKETNCYRWRSMENILIDRDEHKIIIGFYPAENANKEFETIRLSDFNISDIHLFLKHLNVFIQRYHLDHYRFNKNMN